MALAKVTLGEYYDKLSSEQKAELAQGEQDTQIRRKEYINDQLRAIYSDFKNVPAEIVSKLSESYGLDFNIRMFLKDFNDEDDTGDDTLSDLCAENGTHSARFQDL